MGPIALFEDSLHGMVLVDDDRRAREVNHAACVMVQRPKELFLRLRIDDLTAPVALPGIGRLWAELMEKGTLTGRWPLVRGDQRLIEVDFSGVARSRGSLHLFVFITRPVSVADAGAPMASGVALSARETEVLNLLALGFTGPEIAERLVLGVDTVRTHIRNLKRKLGARTLPHLIALATARQK